MFELSQFLLGICFDAPDDSGGGMSIEEITNRKLSGENPEPKPQPKAKEEDDDPDPPPEPNEDDDEEDEATPEPKGREDADSDDAPSTKQDKPKGDEGGGSDDEGDFFDPERHVEGKPAHSNKFKTREQAEYAAIAKADLLKEKIDKMKEDGVSPGAIPLPKALNNNLDSIEQFTSLEVINAMDDDELRSFLNESDATRQRFEEKHNRVKNEKQVREAKSRYEEVQIELYDDLEKVLTPQEIEANIDKLGSKDTAKDFIEKSINNKVKKELTPLKEDLEEWIDKVDNGEINLSIKEFDKQKQAKVDAIEAKAKELRNEFGSAMEKVDELYELHDKVGEAQKQSPEALKKKMFDAFNEFQQDRTGIMPILDDDPSAKAELVAAKKYAIQNKEQFNNLQTPNDWVKALNDGWEKHKANIRAQQQRKQLEGGGKKKGSDGDGKDDVPKPGDQSKLDTNFTTDAVHSSNKRSLDKLVELTNSRI